MGEYNWTKSYLNREQLIQPDNDEYDLSFFFERKEEAEKDNLYKPYYEVQ